MMAAVPSALAEAARKRLAGLGAPTRAAEDWRYVDCAPLSSPAEGAAKPAELHSAGNAAPTALPAIDCAGVDDQAMLMALVGRGAALRCSGIGSSSLRIHGGGDQAHLVHLTLAGGTQWKLHVEHDLAAGARAATWIDIRLAEGAELEITDIDCGHQPRRLMGWTIHLAREAKLRYTATSTGGDLARSRLEVRLAEADAACDLASIDVASQRRQAHRLTRVVHAAPRTVSRQLIKAVLHDRASASCDALVSLLAGSDGADADLQNRNLLLSDQARADSRPQIDARCDEVKAAHGASIGALDAEELLYLRCRGIDAEAARGLLVQGFVQEVALRSAGIPVEAIAKGALP